MVTWHLTMKLFPAKCHEQATLRKLWRQTGNSSLLPAKCWPLLHVIAGISARFLNFAFVLFCYNKLLNDWSLGEHWILFPENLKVSWDEVDGNIEILRKQNSLFPEGPVIKWFVTQQNKTKAKFENSAEIPAIPCNSGQHFAGNSELFPIWRHSFRNVARSWHLTVNSFLVRCRVTMN